MLKLPIVFAHRGANSFAPENSISAFEKAIELGCDGIELDVRLCASGDVVVFHDRNTFRMTGIRRNIHRMTLSEIKELRLKDINLFDEKIPTLPEVLELAKNNILINIDIKKSNFSNNGFEEKIVNILERFKVHTNVLISSFNPFVLKKISALNPKLHLGYIFRNRSSMMILNGHPVQSLHARYRILDKSYIKNLNKRAGKIYAWTVDDGKSMLQQIENGIHGIITNKPEIFFELKNKISNLVQKKSTYFS